MQRPRRIINRINKVINKEQRSAWPTFNQYEPKLISKGVGIEDNITENILIVY